MNYHSHIVRNAQICGGDPVIRGTRVTLRSVLASLAEGATDEEILGSYPGLTPEDVRAVIAISDSKVRVRRP